MTDTFINKLNKICSGIIENEPMNKRTTFRIGGAAQIFTEPESSDEICNVIKLCRNKNVPYIIIGNGSNLLVGDNGIDGVVIHIGNKFANVTVDGNTITAQSGILLSRLANTAKQNSLTGIEFASGIPGTLGGAIFMNAGAYGGEMKDIVQSVTYADENGDIRTVSGKDADFGYRHSIFSDKKYAVLECTIKLERGDINQISELMKDYTKRRNDKQPIDMPSAGSTFKRPEGHFAGQLIENAGLKGISVGGAQVSEKHAGFIVNKGRATSSDVVNLIELVKNKVFENSGVMLEPEVKIIGK